MSTTLAKLIRPMVHWLTRTTFGRQFYFFCRKNFTMQIRYWKSSLGQVILSPILALLLMYGLQQAINNVYTAPVLHPPVVPLRSVARCQPAYRSKSGCITVMFAPSSDPVASAIMQDFVALNGQRGGSIQMDSWSPGSSPSRSPSAGWSGMGSVDVNSIPSGQLGVVGVPDDTFLYSYFDANPNITAWGVSFSKYPSMSDPTLTDYQYTLWYNYTETSRKFRISGAPSYVIGSQEPFDDVIVSMMRALDEAIIDYLNGNSQTLRLQVSTKDFPDVGSSALDACHNPDGPISTLGPVFMLIPMTVIFFNAVNMIVNEKEKGLKDIMEMIGLMPFVYWFAHYFSIFFLILVNAFTTVVVGEIIGFSVFRKTDFGLMFLFFILYGMAWASFALFVSSVTNRVKVGIGFGFFFIIISVIYCSLGSNIAYIWYSSPGSSPDLNPGWGVLEFFPFFNFLKFMSDVLSYTSSTIGIKDNACYIQDGVPFVYANLYQVTESEPTARKLTGFFGQSMGLLFMNAVVWFVLALYFDQVVPNDDGYSRHPLFFLFPSFWGYQDPLWMRSGNTPNVVPVTSLPPESEDIDVVAERKQTIESLINVGQKEDQLGLRIVGLHKRYDGGLRSIYVWLCRILGFSDAAVLGFPAWTGPQKLAIHELSLNINRGSMLALLGSNGAGKTSTMKIMCGMSPPTAGDAYIFGMSIRSQMLDIRKILGVCPQFDILFPDMSAKEHVELFSGIKGIPDDNMEKVAEERLKHMKLWKVKDQPAGQYSGGMKRRLSVILATLGDPECVFLDEPTTGMDPVNKRYVWSFLENFKKGRVIILTTHSMEEADMLADKIAIMTKGRLKAVGKSIRLKNRFGTGYRISLIVSRGIHVPQVKEAVIAACPEAKLDEEEYVGTSGTASTAGPPPPYPGNPSAPLASPPVALNDRSSQTCRLVFVLTAIESVKQLVSFLERECKPSNKENSNSLGSMIASFGMSQTTLEDVFLNFVK